MKHLNSIDRVAQGCAILLALLALLALINICNGCQPGGVV